MRLGLFLISLVILLFLCSLLIGHTQAPISNSLQALILGQGSLGTVMQEIRLPRAILAALVGGSLGLSGAAMQGYLRNPLAEPGLIGISGSASLGGCNIFTNRFGCYILACLAFFGLGNVSLRCVFDYASRW